MTEDNVMEDVKRFKDRTLTPLIKFSKFIIFAIAVGFFGSVVFLVGDGSLVLSFMALLLFTLLLVNIRVLQDLEKNDNFERIRCSPDEVNTVEDFDVINENYILVKEDFDAANFVKSLYAAFSLMFINILSVSVLIGYVQITGNSVDNSVDSTFSSIVLGVAILSLVCFSLYYWLVMVDTWNKVTIWGNYNN